MNSSIRLLSSAVICSSSDAEDFTCSAAAPVWLAVRPNPAPPGEKIELVYLGLIPEARGRGLGSRLLRHGLRQIHQRTESTVSLAVDEQNTPAIQLYKQQGFRRVMRRMAMIRSLADARKS